MKNWNEIEKELDARLEDVEQSDTSDWLLELILRTKKPGIKIVEYYTEQTNDLKYMGLWACFEQKRNIIYRVDLLINHYYLLTKMMIEETLAGEDRILALNKLNKLHNGEFLIKKNK